MSMSSSLTLAASSCIFSLIPSAFHCKMRRAVDAGREVVEDEQFLSVYFSVGSDIDVRHIDLFLLGEAVYG